MAIDVDERNPLPRNHHKHGGRSEILTFGPGPRADGPCGTRARVDRVCQVLSALADPKVMFLLRDLGQSAQAVNQADLRAAGQLVAHRLAEVSEASKSVSLTPLGRSYWLALRGVTD